MSDNAHETLSAFYLLFFTDVPLKFAKLIREAGCLLKTTNKKSVRFHFGEASLFMVGFVEKKWP
jgi:hypothetical protein